MNAVDRHALVGQTLTTLAGGLSPFVTQVLNRLLPPGTDWAQLMRAKDAANGRGGGRNLFTALRRAVGSAEDGATTLAGPRVLEDGR